MIHPPGETSLVRRDDRIALILIEESPKQIINSAIHLGNPSLLQFGDDPASLASGIGRLGNGDPASIVGAIADVLAARPLVERRKGWEKWKSWWQRFRKAPATKSTLR